MAQSIAVESISPKVIAKIQFPPSDLLSDEPPLKTDWHPEQKEWEIAIAQLLRQAGAIE